MSQSVHSAIVIPERDSEDWDRAVASMGLEAQTQLLPYALGFFALCLPVFVTIAFYVGNPMWLVACLGVYAFNWAVFYAIIDWRKRNRPGIDSVRLHTGIHLAAGLLWSLAILQTTAFAVNAGPFRETLLLLCAGAAFGVIFFSSPSLPMLLTVGPAAVIGPAIALRMDPATTQSSLIVLGGAALVMAFGLVLNRHLRSHFALALDREGLIVEREGALTATKKLAKSKSDILATLSNEVRNGLSGVTHVLAGALGAGSRGAPSREQLKAALASARDLISVLDATVDSEVAESGRLTVGHGAIDTVALAHETAVMHKPAASAKGLEIKVQVEQTLSSVPGAAMADAVRVRQVLGNLIGNAVKYTVRGRVEVRVFKPSAQFVRIEVADTGPGLDPGELSRAFEPFERIERTGAGVAGAGLGLPLSRRLSALMGGYLGAESAPGVGSRFWLDLPWDAKAVRAANPQSSTRIEERALRVMVLDDDPLSVAMLRAVLEQLGHGVLHLSDLQRASDLMAAGIDVVMVGGSSASTEGSQVIGLLRELPGPLGHTPVIAIIGGDPEEITRVQDAGADAVLRRPVSVASVARALADCHSARESYEGERAMVA